VALTAFDSNAFRDGWSILSAPSNTLPMSRGVCAEEIGAEDKISPFKGIQKVVGLKGEIVRTINHYPSPNFLLLGDHLFYANDFGSKSMRHIYICAEPRVRQHSNPACSRMFVYAEHDLLFSHTTPSPR
jgi:hypothetical protein